MLWVKDGKVMRFGSVLGMTNKVPHETGALTRGRIRLLLSKGHSCHRPRRTGERKRKSVWDALCMPVSVFSTCSL